MPQNRVPANVVAAARSLNAARQTAQRLGLPLTVNDSLFRVSVPDAQNAAPLYQKIHALYQKDRSKNNLSPFLKPTRTGVDRQAARQDLKRYANILQLAEQAARRPHCVFARNWSLGLGMPFPEYSSMRAATRFLAAQAILQMEANDPVNALKSLRNGIAIANHASEQSPVIPFLVSSALTLIVNQTYHELFLRFGARPEILPHGTSFQRKLTERSPWNNLRIAFRGEAFLNSATLEQYRSEKADNPFEPDGPPIPGIPTNLTPAERRLYADAWETRHWQYWTEIFAEIRHPGSTLRSLYQKASTLATAHEAKMQTTGRDFSYLVTAILTPVFVQVIRKAMQVEAIHRLNASALQAIKVKQTTGKYPASLPNPLLDPFIDQPLLYRRTANGGYILYSRSINGRDDNGDPTIAKRGNKTPTESEGFPLDITFRLP